jgi:hypothetical protein
MGAATVADGWRLAPSSSRPSTRHCPAWRAVPGDNPADPALNRRAGLLCTPVRRQ